MTNADCYAKYGGGLVALVHINGLPSHSRIFKRADGKVEGRMTCALCVGVVFKDGVLVEPCGASDAEHYDPKIGWYVHEECVRRVADGTHSRLTKE